MSSSVLMRDVLQRIATGPHLSKDLSRDQAREAMLTLLDNSADPVQAGIFLIALRMKRETDDEIAGVLDAINAGIKKHTLAVESLTTLVDPYNGFARGAPVNAFLPCVLAACGVTTLSHGVLAMGPKFGATHEQVLTCAGMGPAHSLSEAASLLENKAVAWCYLNQETIAPQLANLSELRTRIVKRSCLTTIEVALNPFAPTKQSQLLTGFVHKAYPPTYAMLAHVAGFDSATLVRGVEGGIIPSLSQASRYFHSVHGSPVRQIDLDPSTLGIEQSERAVSLTEALAQQLDAEGYEKTPNNDYSQALAEHTANCGLAALQAQKGAAYDALVYGAAIVLHAQNVCTDLATGVAQARAAIDEGLAIKHFNAAKNALSL